MLFRSSSVSQISFVFGSWDNARSGAIYGQRLHWVLLGVVVSGLLFEMLPWRRLNAAGLALLLFLPCLSALSFVQMMAYNGRVPTAGDLPTYIGMALVGSVLIVDPARAAMGIAQGPGLALLVAAILSFWAVPRLQGALFRSNTMRGMRPAARS